MFIYSLETHIAYHLNNASRNKEVSKAITLGPFSAALNRIIYGTEAGYNKGKKLNSDKMTDLWRGLSLDDAGINEHI